MKRITTAIACLACCLLASPAQAEEKKAMADPSGTWRWDFEMNGDAIENVLKLNADKDGKLTGTLEARTIKMDVQEGKVNGDEISFQVVLELGQKITIQFEGKIAGDKIDGDMTAKGDGETREFSWEAKRSVLAGDIVGAWQLTIVTADGETLEPVLTITEMGKDLLATYSVNDKTVDAKELKLKDNQLTYEVESEYKGSPLHVEFTGRPLGGKMKGSLTYSVDGNSGELDFTAMLKENKDTKDTEVEAADGK